MSTTNSGFVQITTAALVGATVQAAGAIVALNPDNAKEIVNGGGGTRLDKLVSDLATAGYAKNGAATVSLNGTTPVTVSLADLTSNTAKSAGDTSFATWNSLLFTNNGASDLTIAPAGSNPATIQLAGTTPTLTVAAGSSVLLQSVAGVTVDSTHKSITITPAATGTASFAVGGA